MLRRTDREILQWGYVALVGIGLTVTTLLVTAANFKPAERQLASRPMPGNACVFNQERKQDPGQQVCELTPFIELENELRKTLKQFEQGGNW